MSNNKMATKADLQELYNRILPYLGGMPEFVSDKLNRSDIYSTTEKIVGCWTDGKPIYQRVISTTMTTYTDSTNRRDFIYSLSSFGIDTPIAIKAGYVKLLTGSPTFTFAVPSTFLDTSKYMNYGMQYQPSELRVGLNKSWATTQIEIKLTIQYTKTADSKNSYNCADENDYTTAAEKIIGTWIDGSPIYQSVVNLSVLCKNNYSSLSTASKTVIDLRIKQIINIKGTYLISNGTTGGFIPQETSGFLWYFKWFANNNLSFAIKGDWSTLTSMYATIQYTKTT